MLPIACPLEHGHMLFHGLQSIIFTISQKCAEDEDLIDGGSAKTKSALCILKLGFDCFTTSRLRHFALTFPERLSKKKVLVISGLFLVSFFVNRY